MTFVALGPVGGVDYPRTYQEFRAWFPDDASCADYLARLRWPEGFRCPVCGGDKAWQTATSTGSVPVRRKTSLTAGTYFTDAYAVDTWFAAIWLVTSQKNGASAQNLHDMLGLGSDDTAWDGYKLRRAMVDPTVSCSLGWSRSMSRRRGPRHRQRGASTEKVPVMTAVENVGTQVNRKLRLGRVRLGAADAPGSYNSSSPPAPPSHRVRRSARRPRGCSACWPRRATPTSTPPVSPPEPGHVTLPGPHRVASLLKRWNANTHHNRVEREHLQTTSTSSPSDSIDARHGPADCSSTGSRSRRQHRSPPTGRPYRRITVKLPDEERNERPL